MTGNPSPLRRADHSEWLSIENAETAYDREGETLLMLNCGLHPGECTGLKIDDLDLRKRHPSKTKSVVDAIYEEFGIAGLGG